MFITCPSIIKGAIPRLALPMISGISLLYLLSSDSLGDVILKVAILSLSIVGQCIHRYLQIRSGYIIDYKAQLYLKLTTIKTLANNDGAN